MVVISEISSSPLTLVHRYDVFLNFRGFDTRYNFTDHLYNTLKNANITTFLDDEEIETGLSLKPELEAAIKASRSSIIVLSQNYASSTWCLDELVLILEQVRNPNYFLMPIFYHVEPTDVRKQQNSFGEAMAKHEQRMETETNAEKRSQWAQKIDLWKKALTKVADLKGEYIAKNRKEVDFIEQIVTNIRRRLGVLLTSPQPLIIGMDYDIEDITSWLKDGSSHTADILTISGMGGIGKTTLAKYVYRLNCGEFQRSSFIEGVSRTCAQQYNGLLDLQKQIFGDISKPSSIQVHGDVSVHTSKIENAISLKKVFVVLDDVDGLDQLDALLGNKGFHPGCKVIITTQDASLTERYLLNLVVQPKHTKLLLEGLYEYESLKLLRLSAFKCNDPEEGYEEVSKKVVKYCEGHPLALEVLGKSLRNKDVAEWEDYIERLIKKGPHSHIKEVLQMSLKSLEEDEKELFKHIACFFVGKDRESSERILKACGIHTVSGIRNLIDRCLLQIGQDGKLWMHQLLQEMGRDVVRQESPNRPEKRSLLWCNEESFKVLKQKKGKGNVLGLALDMRMLEKDKLYALQTDALSKMDNIKLLQLNYVQLKGSYENFPEELRWLCMHGFPLDYIPPALKLENLVGLDMSYSRLISFDLSYSDSLRSGKRQKLTELALEDEPLLGSLKTLNLSCCEQLLSIGGFSEFPALERLILSNCISLIEVCESIEQCDRLEHIDLSYCIEAGKFLRTIGKVKNVKILDLDGCNLSELPIKRNHLELPEMVETNNMVINSQTSSSAIEEVRPRDFRSSGIFLPSSLVRLSLKNNHLCNESFPMDMSILLMLKELCLDGNDIVSMPICVRTLPSLEILSIENCPRLTTIEHPPRTLKRMIFVVDPDVGKVVFDQDMSPIKLIGTGTEGLGSFIEGVFIKEDMGDVKEEVLHSLGWTNLDTTKLLPVQDQGESRLEMLYQFGIFSIFYLGKEMPKWISERREGSSISFTIPSSPNNLRGLNLCYVFTDLEKINLLWLNMRIINVTKGCTWIYHYDDLFDQHIVEDVVHLSHWMFGKNEMEDGDQITISISETVVSEYYPYEYGISECGVSFVYDEDEDDHKGKKKMESFKVLKQKKGKGNVLGLALDMRMLEKDKLYALQTDALSKMDNIKLLQLNYVQLKGSYENFPEELRWLCMHGFPLDYIPPALKLENLVGLDMSYSRLISFDLSYSDSLRSGKRQKLTELALEDEPLLGSLKTLNLSCCEQLLSIGGFSEFPALERLILSNCISLIEVCESIEQCDRLEHIDLSYCIEAGKFLRTIGKVKNVKILDLDGCNLSELPIKRNHLELPEMVETNNMVINSQTSSSAIEEVRPRDFRSSGIFLPSSLVRLSLKNNHLCNESFPMDMSILLMLKELCLDGNDIVSMPICVRTLPSLEILSIENCPRLTTIEHPPRTLKRMIFVVDPDVGKVVFDQDMSPIKLIGTGTEGLGSFIEGVFIKEDMGDVKEEVLHSLGWTNLDTTKLLPVQDQGESRLEMLYQFGIFSIFYLGKEMPKWISERREGSSISFTIPSSPNNLRGLNLCYVFTDLEKINLLWLNMRIINVTKGCTWIYHYDDLFDQHIVEDVVHLSHWMFGKNEMEDGDQITISISETVVSEYYPYEYGISECGVSFVYDEDEDDHKGKKKMEEDALGYYKSWNHIIGGDLSPFQTTTPGEYFLDISKVIGFDCFGDEDVPLFRALRKDI